MKKLTLTILSFSLLTIMSAAAVAPALGLIGVPYFNTVASVRGGKESVTTILPLLSATLFLGQFLSPILTGILPLSPYAAALMLSGVYFLLALV